MVGETSSNTPSSDAAPPVMSLTLTVPDAGQVTQAAVEEADLLASTFEAFRKGKS